MVPTEYRGDPSIISFITRFSRVNGRENERLTRKLGQDLFRLLSAGDLHSLTKIYDKYSNLFGMIQFYDNLLKPVMYDIGEQWAEGRLDVATEHVCVNTANALIKVIEKKRSIHTINSRIKGKVFICTPNGEQHNLACNMLESILLSKGYKVYNASPSLPVESAINSLNNIAPDAILISITLPEHIQTTKNLIRKIRNKFPNVHIFVGGIALNELNDSPGFDAATNTTIIRNMMLSDAVKLVKSTISS
jgi:methanogenic corrinoid protein MtbC1